MLTMAAGIFTVDILTPRGVIIGALYSALLVLSLWTPQPRDTLLFAVLFSGLNWLGYWLSSDHGDPWSPLNRLLSLLTVWASALLLVLWRRKQSATITTLEDIVVRVLRSGHRERNRPSVRHGRSPRRWARFWKR
jgi:hypothetical protein